MTKDGKLIYAATPIRMRFKTKAICNFIESQGHFPIHPFLLMPYESYNPKKISRKKIYKMCLGLVDLCDELWIFGLGSGCFNEYMRAEAYRKTVRSFVKRFDPHWDSLINKSKYKNHFQSVLDKVLSSSQTQKSVAA